MRPGLLAKWVMAFQIDVCTPLTLDSALIIITSHHIFNKQIDLLFNFLNNHD